MLNSRDAANNAPVAICRRAVADDGFKITPTKQADGQGQLI